jgi:hypothetical protein
MPGLSGSREDFQSRLRDFARMYYLSQFDINKAEIFAKFRKGFLSSFIASGKSVQFLHGIIGNAGEIERLARITAADKLSSLPPLPPKSGVSQENADVYMFVAQKLIIKLNSIGSDLVKEFLNSEGFASLPKLYNEARKLIRDLSAELTDEVDRRRRGGEEIYLGLIDDPDEKLVAAAAKELNAKMAFPRFIADIALAMEKDDEVSVNEAVSNMLDTLVGSVKGLSGGSGAQVYMELLSDACRYSAGDHAKKCVANIDEQLIFPLRFNSGGRKKCTFVWGSRENSFYSAWERQQEGRNAENEFLPIDSNERFALLTVSPPFTRGDILGITKAQPRQPAADQRESEPPPEFIQLSEEEDKAPVENEPPHDPFSSQAADPQPVAPAPPLSDQWSLNPEPASPTPELDDMPWSNGLGADWE